MTQNRSSDVRNWAMLCHLSAFSMLLSLPFLPYSMPFVIYFGLIGPLITWLLKREEDPFIDDHGKESLNFQISMSIYTLCLSPLLCICIGAFLLPMVAVVDIIFVIIASLEAASGQPYRYPLTLRFLN